MNDRKLCLCVGDTSLYFACPGDMRLVYDMMHEDEEIKNILFYGAGEDWKWEEFQQTESKWFSGDESKNAYYLIEREGEIIGWISHSYNAAKTENMEIDISFNSLSHTGKGLGTGIIKTLTDYTHEKYGINTCMIRPGKHNKRAIRAYEKSGFKAMDSFDPNDYYTAEDVVLWGDGDLGVDGTFNMIKKYNHANIILRPEQPSDYRETENVTREAFWNHHAPGCDEHYLLHIMRGSPAFVPELDIVAVAHDIIVGNAVYAKSVIKADDGKEYGVLGLGPISVLPAYQGIGIGGQLIEHTKQIARDKDFRAIFLYGDPAYYSQHGFLPAESFDIRTSDNMYAEALQICELYKNALAGITGCYFEDEIYEVDGAAAKEYDKSFPPKEKIEGTASQKRFLEISGTRKERKT